MPKVTIVPFAWYHIHAMDLREKERGYLANINDYVERAKIYQTKGPCFSAIVEGEGIACSWGVVPLWPGVAECWMLTSTLLDRYPLTTIRKARELIHVIKCELMCKRLQMTVRTDDAVAIRFAEALYFRSEGVLNSYGTDGSDFTMMARLDDERTFRGRRPGQLGAGRDAAETAGSPGEAAGEAGHPDA